MSVDHDILWQCLNTSSGFTQRSLVGSHRICHIEHIVFTLETRPHLFKYCDIVFHRAYSWVILFLLYTADIATIIKAHGLHSHYYAKLWVYAPLGGEDVLLGMTLSYITGQGMDGAKSTKTESRQDGVHVVFHHTSTSFDHFWTDQPWHHYNQPSHLRPQPWRDHEPGLCHVIAGWKAPVSTCFYTQWRIKLIRL